MASQHTNRVNGNTADNRRQQNLISGRDDSRFDYGSYYMVDNPTYVATVPAHAYTLNRAYSGKTVGKQHESPTDVSNKLPAKEKQKKRMRHFRLYMIVVLAITILICLAFGLGFGLGQPDVIVNVIVEDIDWDPALTDNRSSSFLRSADVTERSMDRYFRESSMAAIYDYAVVSDFWHGSVGCTARIYLKSPPTDSSQEIKDIYKGIHNTSGEHIMAENLQKGQDALSTQPLTDRVRFWTVTLQIKAFSSPTDEMSSTLTIPAVTTTTLSRVTEASTMSSGTWSSNTTPGTTSNATATSSVSISSTGFTPKVTSLTSVQTTLNGTEGTTSNGNTVTTVSSTSITTATSVVTTMNGAATTTDSGIQNTSTSIGTQWTTPTSTANHTDDMTHVNETVDLAVWANFTLLSVEWNSVLTDKTSDQYKNLADKLIDDDWVSPVALDASYQTRDSNSVTVSMILNIFADKMDITALTQQFNASLHTQQQSTNTALLELTAVDWVKDVTAVLREAELWLWYNGQWKAVCESTFTGPASDVVCHQLGYAHGHAFGGLTKGNALQFSNLNCSSNTAQNSLSECYVQFIDLVYCVVTNLNCHNSLMQYTLEGGDGATYGYVRLNLDNKDGLLCSNEQYTDVMATYLCRELNSTLYGGLVLQADILQKPTRGDVWQVKAKCNRPQTDSAFSDCIQSSWIFFHNATIYSNSMNHPAEQQPYMSDSMECPLNNWLSTTESTNNIPESPVSEKCLMKIYCHTQPVDIYQAPSSNTGYIIATNISDPKVFCRDNFTNLEAAATCKTLGYMKGGTSLTFNPIPGFNSRTWAYTNYGYKCSENTTMYSCTKTEIDVKLQCSGPAVVKCVTDAATEKEGDMKLDSDGNTVLIYYNGQWGTVCDGGSKHPWTTKEATAVCKQLNYTHGVPVSAKELPAVPLPHVITNVTCTDSQAKLADCTYSEVKDDSCNSSYAAKVFCYNSTDAAHLDFVGGSGFNSILVKVTREGKVGYLCTSSLPSKAANVICRNLGFVSGVQDTYANFTDPHLQYIWQTDFNGQCTEDDVSAETCRSAAWVLYTANMSQADRKCVCNDNYVSLFCYGKVKLSLEPRKNYGPLMIYGDSGYNFLCNEDVNQVAATAACREITRLNTSGAVILPPGAFHQAAVSAKDAVFNCTKDAISVSDCITFKTGFNFNCNATSVLCNNGTEISGPSAKNATEWRIEDAVVQVKAYGIWGIVCSDGWSNAEATVLCKTGNSEYTVGITQVGNSLPTVPMWISRVMCDANATNINMCLRKTLSESLDCNLGGVAQTFCFRGENDVPKFILADAEATIYYMKGHLAVTRSNQTGYVCSQDDSDIKQNVDAVCRLMAYNGGQLSQTTVSRNDVRLIWNGSFHCNWYTPDCFLNGNFTQRTDVNYTGSLTASDVDESGHSASSAFTSPCGDSHTLDVLCFTSKVRLEDPESSEGFLLINGINGWQALCSENFTLELAASFCTDAGYLSGNFTSGSVFDAHLTAGFADVTCNNGSRFDNCTFNAIPNEVSYTCHEIVYIFCTKSLNITKVSQ